MNSALLLTRLGFSGSDRVVVLHADDVGMCEATVTAYIDAASAGILSSASAMVPCSWFPAVAAWCNVAGKSAPQGAATEGDGAHAADNGIRTGPEFIDMGIHITLTSEWANYRWGPLLGATASVLCDESGYFPEQSAPLQRRAARDAVRAELQAQIRRARHLGVDITHLDSHMFTLMHPALVGVYAQVASEFRLPAVILPLDPRFRLDRVEPGLERYLVAFDAWSMLPLDHASNRLEVARRLLGELPAGLSYFLSHPAVDSPELRRIASDWPARVADHRLLTDERWATAVERSGVKVIGMRTIRDALNDLAPGEAGAALD